MLTKILSFCIITFVRAHDHAFTFSLFDLKSKRYGKMYYFEVSFSKPISNGFKICLPKKNFPS